MDTRERSHHYFINPFVIDYCHWNSEELAQRPRTVLGGEFEASLLWDGVTDILVGLTC
jgi:hypothetical protein